MCVTIDNNQVKGFQVAPAELEDVIRSIPEVHPTTLTLSISSSTSNWSWYVFYENLYRCTYIKRATSCQASDVAVIGVPSDRQGEVKISLKPGTIIDILKPLTNTQSYLLLIHIFYFLTFSKVRLQLWSKQFSLIFRFHELMLCEAIQILLRIWWVIWRWHLQSCYCWSDSLYKFTINSFENCL